MANKGLTSPEAIDRAKRRSNALELRGAKVTFEEIANRLGYSSAQHAHRDVMKAIVDLVETPAKDVVAEELASLDRVQQTLWPMVRRGDLSAVDRLLKVMERRARYLGLDQPDRIQAEITVSDIDVAQEILDLVAALKGPEQPQKSK